MATFPTLNPSTRVFSPGVYPHSSFTALSGAQVRVRNSNVMLSSQLRLSYVAITESEMLLIVAHYQTQQGSFQSFPLPSVIWNGATAADYQLTGYGWIYREPPLVTDYPCGYHDVELILETVPPEGTALLGLDQTVGSTITGGAFAFNGAQFNVAVLFAPGVTGPAGLTEAVTCSLAAGSATASVAASGLNLVIAVTLDKGPDTSGLSALITVSLAVGAAVASNGLAKTVTASITAGTTGDLYFSSVKLLLHMNGINNSTTFTDSSSTALSLTANGNSKISTTRNKFGSASGYFDGNGDYLSAAFDAGFDLLGSDFTVECWVYAETFKSSMRVAAAGGGAVAWNITNGIHWLINFDANGALDLQLKNTAGTAGVKSTTTVATNTWTHIAVCASGSTGYVAIGGTVRSGSLGTIQRPSSNPTLNIASIPGESGASSIAFQGYIDEFRITKGVARYTANFTPAAEAFPDS